MEIKNQCRLSSEDQITTACEAASDTEIKPDLGNLRSYSQAKLELAGQLRIVRQWLAALGRENEEKQCGELIVKLAEDRFTLATLGQFKRGKSSLMNAIIGRELLPTGVLPLTSAITTLKYGPVERLIVTREDSIFPEELPVSSLAEFVTEKGNPANRKRVKTACVELPVPFLRRGVEFVDTPGVGSANEANSATTYSFLPECDAVLFVTSVDSPLTSLELAFLKDIRTYVDKIFFVVNKIDLLPVGERHEVLGFVVETIRTQTGREDVKVFSVSAREGLAARMSGNRLLYEQSGLKALEETLAAYLTREKSATFLAAVAHKALRILDTEAGGHAVGNEGSFAGDKAGQGGNIIPDCGREAAVMALATARQKIETLYCCMLKGRFASATPSIEMPRGSTAASTDSLVLPVSADPAADLQTRGCPVCGHIAEQARDFFVQWQYKLGTEEWAQAEFAEKLGFCPLHTWQLLAISSPHGASVGYAQLAEQVAFQLRNLPVTARENDVRRLVSDSQNCRACELLRKSEKEYIRTFAGLIEEPDGQKKYRQSQGVCLRHLGMLLEGVTSDGSRKFLLAHAAQRFEEDAEDMRSFAMKHEAIRRGLQNRNEKDAYRRAIIRIVGDSRVCTPWSVDGEM